MAAGDPKPLPTLWLSHYDAEGCSDASIMRRREFIGLVGVAAVRPCTTRSQQLALPTVGFLRSATLGESTHMIAAFRLGLKEAGFVEGQNVKIEFLSAEDHPERLPGLATELINRRASLIVGDNIAALAAKATTTTIPIIFAGGGDPVQEGLVDSLNRPGHNVTGINFFTGTVGTKRLELLHEMVPDAKIIAALFQPNTIQTKEERSEIEAAARAIGRSLLIFDVNSADAIDDTFAILVQRGAHAVLIGSGPFMNSHRTKLVELASRYARPAIFTTREAAVAGGLMSYGTSLTEALRQTGTYAGRVLKGEKPADLPVMRATKFEFVLNLKTAKALGLSVPNALLATADEVIE
jgi:ABC-type uncharacterized transport system substrate-binding protein